MYLLSLDISTTTTGYCLWKDGVPLEAGAIETKAEKIPDKFDRIDHILVKIEGLVSKWNIKIDKFAAESALEKFTAGKTTAKTIAALAGFNFCLCYALSRRPSLSNKSPAEFVMVNVRSARNACGIKIPKDVKDKKEYVTSRVFEMYPNLPWEKKKTGKFKDWNQDMADAVVIGLSVVSKMAPPAS